MPAISPNHKAIEEYHRELAQFRALHADYEQATRAAFEHLLRAFQSLPGWTLLLEQPLANGKKPDGTFRDAFILPRGYWEAKDTADDLDAEITKKLQAGYPTTNTIFEDTRRAVLYQGGRRIDQFDLTDRRAVADLLTAFFGYTETPHENFYAAVAEFKERVPDLAKGLLERIRQEHAADNPRFSTAWANFYKVCRESLDPNMRSETVDEMLVQHLLTERLFRTVFNNPDFVRRNIIAAEIEKVIDGLTSRAFNRADFTRALDRFYVAIEGAAPTDWSEKQAFMNMVYERFFQGFSIKQADTHGIVYTPQEIVDFMCASVEEVLRTEFHTSLSEPGVQILDPATGTGSFIANILRRISGVHLEHKYRRDLFANEIMLLPYYIASLNIEHTYYERTGQYLPFEGLCFADTLDMEGQQMVLFTERNTERVQAEKAAQIMVVIGNPPYNVGQESENDNNKNRKYDAVDGRIRDTYAKDSRAKLKTKYYDAYVKFIRWATDRLRGHDGIVCFVTNNSFVRKDLLDGIRKHLARDFTTIYHLDLGGDMREGGGGNVFGITPSVGITALIRKRDASPNAEVGTRIFYHKVEEALTGSDKLEELSAISSISGTEWERINPDERHSWLNEGLRGEFSAFLPIGVQDRKSSRLTGTANAIFRDYSLGVSTNRDGIVYDFDKDRLIARVSQFIEDYNAEVFRWVQAGRPSKPNEIDAFVRYEKVKWSEHLKAELKREHFGKLDNSHIRTAMYRPFCVQYLYYDALLNDRPASFKEVFPSSVTTRENAVIVVSDRGYRASYSALATSMTPDLHLLASTDGFQCFPLYTYDEDGSNRRDNITDWALARFRAAYGESVTKHDIFHYVYAILHHPLYRARYAENLKRELPRIPLVAGPAAFAACVEIGRELARLHLEYDTLVGDRAGRPPDAPTEPAHATPPAGGSAPASVLRPFMAESAPQAENASVVGVPEYPLEYRETPGVAPDWTVKKMRLTPDKTALIYNDWLTLAGIPPQALAYRLGNRSALEWVIDQYHVSTDPRSGITSDPNRRDDPRYIVGLIRRVLTVSVETVRLVERLARDVTLPIPSEDGDKEGEADT